MGNYVRDTWRKCVLIAVLVTLAGGIAGVCMSNNETLHTGGATYGFIFGVLVLGLAMTYWLLFVAAILDGE